MWVGQVHSWSHGWPYFPLRKLPWKFHFDIFIRHLSRMEGHSSWYLADIEGSWWDTWMTGSSLISLMTKFDTKKDTLKVLCQYFHWKCVKKGSCMVVLGGHWKFLTGDFGTGSCMISWMYVVDPEDHILKVLYHIYIWRRYKGEGCVTSVTKKVENKQKDKDCSNLYGIKDRFYWFLCKWGCTIFYLPL